MMRDPENGALLMADDEVMSTVEDSVYIWNTLRILKKLRIISRCPTKTDLYFIMVFGKVIDASSNEKEKSRT